MFANEKKREKESYFIQNKSLKKSVKKETKNTIGMSFIE